MAGAVRERVGRAAGPAHPGRAVVLALLLVLVVLLGLLLTDVLERGADEGSAAGQALSADAYRDVVLGVDREALTERLLPVRPVQEPVSTGGDLPPAPEGTRCLYYATSLEGGGHYRFCFADDRLVDKAVVPPYE